MLIYQGASLEEYLALKAATNTILMVLQKEKKQVFKLLANYMDGKIDADELKKSDLLKSYDNSWVQELSPAQKKELRETNL